MIIERRGKKAAAVLLPLDEKPESFTAFPVARHIATLADATLHIVHVSGQRLEVDELRRRLALSADQMADIVLHTAAGAPADAIVRLARERRSMLITLAMHGGHPKPDTGLGSVAETVLRSAPCPVLLVPPQRIAAQWRMAQVLLPQDGTPGTAAALEPIVHLAHSAGATLFVVHVSSITAPAKGGPGTLSAPRYIDQPHHEWPMWSDEFIDRIRGLCHLPGDLEIRMFLARGDPAEEIVRLALAREADLIVLPWHGSLEPHRAAIVKAVIREAPCPILILPYYWASRRTMAL